MQPLTLAAVRLALAGLLLSGLSGLLAGPASADCTSSVRYERGRSGDVVPRRQIDCAATAAERERASRERTSRLAACEAAGFGGACAQLAAEHDAAVERHRLRLERLRARARAIR
jgi:hypothetical protein